MRNKLRSVRGETLIEVLCAILIGSLSVTLLFGMVMASASMDRGAREADKTSTASLNAAEGRTDASGAVVPPVTGAVVRVKNKDAGIPGEAVLTEPKIKFYGGQGAVSYALDTTGGSPP